MPKMLKPLPLCQHAGCAETAVASVVMHGKPYPTNTAYVCERHLSPFQDFAMLVYTHDVMHGGADIISDPPVFEPQQVTVEVPDTLGQDECLVITDGEDELHLDITNIFMLRKVLEKAQTYWENRIDAEKELTDGW